MATRLDVSSEARLRNLASSSGLDPHAVDEALRRGGGDAAAAEAFLRRLAAHTRGRPSTSPPTPEARITKCSWQLAEAAPAAFDILFASLTKVLREPTNERLRKINVTSGPFKEQVASRSAAAVELLYAVGYVPMHGFLVLQKHDSSLLSHALHALNEARAAPGYVAGKATMADERARKEATAQEQTAAALRRAAHRAKVPAEPAADDGGRASSACVITVKLAGIDPYEARVGTRRFDSDNTLNDLVHYIRSLDRVPESERLTIENVTTRPARVLDPATQGSLSLYALDLWPRAQVQVGA